MSSLTIVTASGSGSTTVKIVKPANNALHQAYTFYLKISAEGGSYTWFGPYVLNVGCFAGSLTLTQNTALVSSVTKYIGFPVASAYTFSNPTSNRAWCTHTTNAVVQNDGSGTAWSGTVKLTGSGS